MHNDQSGASSQKAREKQGIKHVTSHQNFILLLESLGVTSRLLVIVGQNQIETAWRLTLLYLN